MVGIYIGIACLAVLLVATLVENLPKYLVSKKADVKTEVKIHDTIIVIISDNFSCRIFQIYSRK